MSDKTPLFLSALVYPGAGQFLQRRWVAGVTYSLAFTVFFALLLVTVVTPLARSLNAAFQWAAHQQNRPFQGISIPRVIALFAACTITYIANLVDVTHAARPPRVPS